MHITERRNQLKTTAVAVGRIIGGHERLSIAVAAALLIGGPLSPAATERTHRRTIHNHRR